MKPSPSHRRPPQVITKAFSKGGQLSRHASCSPSRPPSPPVDEEELRKLAKGLRYSDEKFREVLGRALSGDCEEFEFGVKRTADGKQLTCKMALPDDVKVSRAAACLL